MKRAKILYLILLLANGLSAQVINLNFPHFAGKEYVFALLAADQMQPVQQGVLDENGQAVIVVPKEYANYQGIGLFRLTEGGGLDIILNNEKAFTISCTEPMPDDENIFYIGSQENIFLVKNYLEQEDILNKYSAMRSALEAYDKNNALYAVFEKEEKQQETSYNILQGNIEQSNYYAAFLRGIHNFLRGLPERLGESSNEKVENTMNFITKKLNINWLYTSNSWDNFWEEWLNRELEDENQLLSDTKTVFSIIPTGKITDAWLNTIETLYTRYGKDSLLNAMGLDRLVGKTAPELYDGTKQIIPKNAIVVFYDSGCGHCQTEMEQIKNHYPQLQSRGIRVISVAADADTAAFEAYADSFQWKDKLCDYQGFEGKNFVNYGILGTPTLFWIDGNGKIGGRYAMLKDIIKQIL
ncbi:MAG: TlpA family protein disulfide reductase [Prevotellaceae bacterium]|jgi:hypothetical protein|nr:TlpA family protein disulfide reductase [Prevotellaceae bacterium]